MGEVFVLLLSWVAGCALGAMFFGGLWLTVNKGLVSDQAALWFLGSLLVRMTLAIGGFYFVSGGHWDRLFLALLGFLIARLVVTRMTLPRGVAPGRAPQEAGHSA